eukprot:2613438-Rhodomonas_salina.1
MRSVTTVGGRCNGTEVAHVTCHGADMTCHGADVTCHGADTPSLSISRRTQQTCHSACGAPSVRVCARGAVGGQRSRHLTRHAVLWRGQEDIEEMKTSKALQMRPASKLRRLIEHGPKDQVSLSLFLPPSSSLPPSPVSYTHLTLPTIC